MNFVPLAPRLYQVQLGMGYLELPQVEVPHGKLRNTLLNNRNVYILDCHVDVYVWYVLFKSLMQSTKSKLYDISTRAYSIQL